MALDDNEYLAKLYSNYKPTACRCGKPDSVFHPGKCGDHAEEDLSVHIDKHAVGRGRSRGGAAADD